MAYRALEQPRIGWIGAGRMGLQMASRLLDAGHDVAIYNRTAAKAAPIISRGAVAVDQPADLADRDVVFTMVSGSDDLLQVTTGAHGVLTAPGHSPALLVDFSTVSMEASAAVRDAASKRETDFLAAPVSGNPKVVSAGKLSLAVSGGAGARFAAGRRRPVRRTPGGGAPRPARRGSGGRALLLRRGRAAAGAVRRAGHLRRRRRG